MPSISSASAYVPPSNSLYYQAYWILYCFQTIRCILYDFIWLDWEVLFFHSFKKMQKYVFESMRSWAFGLVMLYQSLFGLLR